VRHEEAAAFAACGYARYTGRMGVCLATSGPGGIHLLNGLYDAAMDNQPVLAITGHTFHDLIGTHYQQDVDLDKLFMDVSVYNERVMGPHHVISVVDEAVKMALTRRGVAHITIPKDIQDWTMEDSQQSMGNKPKHSGAVFAPVDALPPQEQLQQAADVINAGKKVAILAGRGCLEAGDEVTQLAEVVAGPIVKPLLGKGVVPDRSPYTTGGLGYPYMEFLPKEVDAPRRHVLQRGRGPRNDRRMVAQDRPGDTCPQLDRARSCSDGAQPGPREAGLPGLTPRSKVIADVDRLESRLLRSHGEVEQFIRRVLLGTCFPS
jgi:hypothetical protein